jgi:hypothetical protein
MMQRMRTQNDASPFGGNRKGAKQAIALYLPICAFMAPMSKLPSPVV